MKIINTRNGKFAKFVKKNGTVLVLLIAAVSAAVAIFTISARIKNKAPGTTNSQINLGGDENKWQANTKPNSQNTSSSQLQQQAQSSSSSKLQSSSNSSQDPSPSPESQQILFISPLNSEILNKFSPTPVKSLTMGDWRVHSGVDYFAEKGTTVWASAAGVVSKIYKDAMWGTTVEIEHANGMTTIYSSLSDKVFVEKGQKVTSKQSIGTVGNTARVEAAEKSHIHFAIKQNDKFLDPETVITKKIGS